MPAAGLGIAVWITPVPHAWTEVAGPPRFLGSPLCICPVLRPRQAPSPRSLRKLVTVPSPNQRRRHLRRKFRGSITRLLHSLCTLRPPSYPDGRNTRYRLLTKLYRAEFQSAELHCKVSRTTHCSCDPPWPSFPGALTFLLDPGCGPGRPTVCGDDLVDRADQDFEFPRNVRRARPYRATYDGPAVLGVTSSSQSRLGEAGISRWQFPLHRDVVTPLVAA